jgi:TPR repeat protein
MKAKLYLLAALMAASACAGAQASDPLVRKLEQLAERGNGEAQYYLGMAYWVGRGCRKR